MKLRWLTAACLVGLSLSSMGLTPLYRTFFGRIVDTSIGIIEEVKYRKYRLDQYRSFSLSKFKNTYHAFLKV